MSGQQKKGDWFLIMVSWEPGEDLDAAKSFNDVLEYLRNFKSQTEEEIKARNDWLENLDATDPRSDIIPDSLRGLNLIGRRKFVIIFQAKSNPNNLLLHLSKKISWDRNISVEIFPAAYVFEVETIFREEEPKKNPKP